MEEYKKKYEEAMLRMTKWVEGSEIIDPKEVAEFVFPELKESEDEKIKKEIINYISKQGASIKYNFDAWIAWLEKQGENTHNKELSELLHKVICRFINDPNIPYTEREKVSMEIIPYVERIEKQGEQKPAWSEEDEMMLNHTISTVKLHLNDVGSDKKEILLVKEEIDWLKSLKERMKGE
jgi:hypothetical protein